MKNKRQPLLWASVLRIFGAACIFMFHFQVLNNKPTYHLALIGLGIFFFLSGWFGNYGNDVPSIWFFKRVKRIFIPYWPIIFIVLVANRVVGYKETTLLKDFITFIGFSYFIKIPVYVISWFITVILILDFTLYVFRLIRTRMLGYTFLLAAFGVFAFYAPLLKIELLLFYVGFLLGGMSINIKQTSFLFITDTEWYRFLNDKFYILQNYTYSFFLIHAAVLISVFRVLKYNSYKALVVALVISIGVAVMHNKILKRFS